MQVQSHTAELTGSMYVLRKQFVATRQSSSGLLFSLFICMSVTQCAGCRVNMQ